MFIHLSTGPHVWIQFCWHFHILCHFYFLSHCMPTSFLFGFLIFHFHYWVSAWTLRHFQPMQLALSQVRTQQFYFFTVWLASIFISTSSIEILVSPCCANKCQALQWVWISTQLIPASHSSALLCALLTSWWTICQGSVFLQFCYKIQQSSLACTKNSSKCIQQFP